jgi:peptide/nickel transport system permease protein
MRALINTLRAAGTLLATLAALVAVTYGLAHLSPIDPALQRLGDHASADSYARVRREMGLDAPWSVQFARYVRAALHGDLGTSRATGEPVSADLERVFPPTFELATLALLLGTSIALALAFVSARFPNSLVDGATRAVSIIGGSVPIFWLGLLMLLGFYAKLHWTGGTGRLSDAFEYSIDSASGLVLLDAWRSRVPGAFQDAVAHLVLPVAVLAAYAVASIARLARAALIAEARREYVTLARAKGAGELRILFRHVLPNAAGLIITIVAFTYANLLQGAVLVETVFARPGLGRYLTTAIFAADLPAILGASLLIGSCFILVNTLADALSRLIDPRRS